jgi:hypothetical protein
MDGRQAVECLLLLLMLMRCCAGCKLQHVADAEVAAVVTQDRLLVVVVAVALRLTGILDLVRPRKKVFAGGVVDRPPAGQQAVHRTAVQQQVATKAAAAEQADVRW